MENNSFLIWEDELHCPALRTFPSQEAAMEWLVENTDRDHVEAIYAEILPGGETWAEHVVLNDLDWPGPHYIAGDWLLLPSTNRAANRYRKGYQAAITGHWSGGVSAEITEQVLRRMAADQPDARGFDKFEFRDDGAFLISDGFESGERRLGPNEFGFYEAPGWAWGEVDADECMEVVTDE